MLCLYVWAWAKPASQSSKREREKNGRIKLLQWIYCFLFVFFVYFLFRCSHFFVVCWCFSVQCLRCWPSSFLMLLFHAVFPPKYACNLLVCSLTMQPLNIPAKATNNAINATNKCTHKWKRKKNREENACQHYVHTNNINIANKLYKHWAKLITITLSISSYCTNISARSLFLSVLYEKFCEQRKRKQRIGTICKEWRSRKGERERAWKKWATRERNHSKTNTG